MSLIFGYYSTKTNSGRSELRPALDDFALYGKRALQSQSGQNFFFSSALNKPGANNILENEDKNMVIVFGGDVFDFHEQAEGLILRGHRFLDIKSPAEFLLHAYEEYGEQFLKDVNGTFAFAIYDKKRDELILANESFGTYPFFHATDQYCIFCTEYQPITKFPSFDRALDYDAIAEFFTLGLPLGNKTFFKSLSNLDPGSVLKKRRQDICIDQYDNLDIKIEKDRDINYFADKISDSIARAVRCRIIEPHKRNFQPL